MLITVYLSCLALILSVDKELDFNYNFMDMNMEELIRQSGSFISLAG